MREQRFTRVPTKVVEKGTNRTVAPNMPTQATTPTDEPALIRRILAGETQLFYDLIRPYEKMVYVTIYAMVRNEQEAEDGAQETLVNAFRHLASFRGESKFSTWLVTIAMNEGRRR